MTVLGRDLRDAFPDNVTLLRPPSSRSEEMVGAQALAELADAEQVMSRFDGGSDGEPLAERLWRYLTPQTVEETP